VADRDPMLNLFAPDLQLRDPIMVAAFRGWNDAGESATFAASHLARVWSAVPIGEIDPEEFYDFQAIRPTVELIDGVTRKISWPTNEFLAAQGGERGRDVLLLIGTEPNLRWKAFSALVADVARHYGVKLVVTLGALLADIPHSRAVPITGTAVSEDLVVRLGLHRSRYEGPTGIVGVLHDSFAAAGIDSASLWAAVPHYLAVSPNPKAALALVERAVELIGMAADISDLQLAASSYEERVAQMVAGDEDVQAYVTMLEERADEREVEESMELPSGESLAAELERFLRERDGEEN
jgi:predicted ATP-grasp superfamily ATP-dependent carboligase